MNRHPFGHPDSYHHDMHLKFFWSVFVLGQKPRWEDWLRRMVTRPIGDV